MVRWYYIFSFILILCSCNTASPPRKQAYFNPAPGSNEEDGVSMDFVCIIDTPTVSDSAVSGMYRGVEFIHPKFIEQYQLNGTDVAHQYSNKICAYVGNHLKKMYLEGKYSKVDFSRIVLSTKGMGSGQNYVEYYVYIPFKRVPKSQAMTAFDHSGGWGHTPEITQRKLDLKNGKARIVKNKRLWVSRKFKTKEGLEEYWIQWQHTKYQ